MGSFFSPSVPKYSPVTYTPPQSVTSTTTYTPSPSESDNGENQQNSDDTQAITNVIKRNRGRSSLIQTSYRGVLNEESDGINAPKRKTLLGE